MTYEEKYKELVNYINRYRDNLSDLDTSTDYTLTFAVNRTNRALNDILEKSEKLEQK